MEWLAESEVVEVMGFQGIYLNTVFAFKTKDNGLLILGCGNGS